MSYHDALNYLAQKTSVIELHDQWGGRVAVSPEWNARVLISTCDGLDGESFGCVNVQAIDADCYEDFGGEDQWSISPLIHSFSVESIKENKAVLQRSLSMNDANGTHVEFQLLRSIFLLNRHKIRALFGDAVADSLEQENVSVVGFRTENTVQSQEKAWIASRQRGMFNASPHTCIIISLPPENDYPLELPLESLPVDIDYLGGSPHSRVRHLPQTLLIRADGHGQCQATMPFSIAPAVFGAVELRYGMLTLWSFDLPSNSEDNSVRIYNSGRPPASEFDRAAYYEANCFSAAQKLLPEQSFTYGQSTLHLNADKNTLDNLIRQIFSVHLEDISRKMLR